MKDSIDHHYRKLGFKLICGIDEAGRGPWAGPVYCSAVILPQDHGIKGLNDSKKLSEKKRNVLYEQIIYSSLSYSITAISPLQIDRINILQATKLGMRKAVKKLKVSPGLILLDAVNISLPEIPQVSLIGGDGRSESIAAASILAKVSRDQYMIKMDAKYPQYGFARHKGYGTKEHARAMQKYGPCKIHRVSFAPVQKAKIRID